jgi:hypothetical protein
VSVFFSYARKENFIMENLIDPARHDKTQSVEVQATMQPSEETQAPVATEEESGATQITEEISTAPEASAGKELPGKTVAKPTSKREEPPPNPLLLDPYVWDLCTITVGYSLLPNKKVSVSVHNHKDEPIVKEFPAEEVPLPEKISGVMATLQSIWPTSPVNATVVLLPKPETAPERPIIASVRVSTDTPIMQEGVESNLPFPAPIVAMLEELKMLIPERALKTTEKKAKAKTITPVKPARKTTASKPATPVSVPATNKNIHKNQMTLF